MLVVVLRVLGWRTAARLGALLFALFLLAAVALLSAVGSVIGPLAEDPEHEPAPHVVAAVGEIPPEYLEAYRRAGERHGVAWQVLAAIGYEETRHGSYAPRRDASGCILGPRTPYGRARGPMQFLQSSWARFGEDGDGDGSSDPCAVADAPFGAARHLRLAPGGSPLPYERALYAYNRDHGYVARVLGAAHAYGWARPARAGGVADPDGGRWYRYQGEAGSYDPWGNEQANCGPAAVAMGVQRSTSLRLPIREVRDFIGVPGYTGMAQLTSSLAHWGVRYRHSIGEADDLPGVLARGNVAIVGVYMPAIARGRDVDGASASPSLRAGRFETTATYHWIVVKGVTRDGASFRVHDPNVWGGPGYAKYWYADGSPKGRDRLYDADEVRAGMRLFSPLPGSRAVELLGASERTKRGGGP